MVNFSAEHLTRVFKNQVEDNHRTMFAITGEDPKQQVSVLHEKLNHISSLSSIIWCYKSFEASLSRETEKLKIYENASKFEKWTKIHNPEYISYKENSRILGKTCDMLVIQDFESLTPNMLACSVETVRGGGAIVLLFDTEKPAKEIVSSESELIAQIIGEKPVSRFNVRLLKALMHFPHVVFLDSNLKIISITNDRFGDNVNLADKSVQIKSNAPISYDNVLFRMCKTKDQMSVLASLMSHLDFNEPSIGTVVAGRGRGKSVALGLAIACAIERRLPLILVSSLFLDNVQTMFEFIAAGLDALEYKRASDYKIAYTFEGKKRLISKIEIVKDYRRIVEFAQPFEELKAYPNLLVIDEAASIPLGYLKRLLNVRLIFMASTVSGYEGTGRVFRTRLAEYIKEKSVKSHTYEMLEPIRYATGDGVEAWLYKSLLLEPKVSQMEQRPLPSECSLYYVNKDVLLNGSQMSEAFLGEIFSLFVASHYRNSPNDMQRLSDSPNHEIFVLMTQLKPSRIVCAIQVSFEGRCSKNSAVKEGNLIPWVVYENFSDEKFLNKLGMRIVRIAVHPDMLSMGHGTSALSALTNLFADKHESSSCSLKTIAETNNGQPSRCSAKLDSDLLHIVCNDQAVLFHPANKIKIPNIDWIGSSFGVSEKLVNFWKRSNFSPVGIKQTPSKTTGEFSIVFLKAIGNKLAEDLDSMKALFLQRFTSLLSYSFKDLPPTLALSLIYTPNTKVLDKKIHFSVDELKRLTKFSKGLIDIKSVMDIFPDLSRLYFYQNDLNKLSIVSQTALLMIGCQRKTTEEVAKYLGLDYLKVTSVLASAVGTLLSADLK